MIGYQTDHTWDHPAVGWPHGDTLTPVPYIQRGSGEANILNFSFSEVTNLAMLKKSKASIFLRFFSQYTAIGLGNNTFYMSCFSLTCRKSLADFCSMIMT